MQTDALNDLIETLHADMVFLFKDTEYVVTRYRTVNDENDDIDFNERLCKISGAIEINRAGDEGEEVGCLEVIAVQGDDKNALSFTLYVDNGGLADTQTFNDAAKASQYLNSMVRIDNTPGVEDFEYGYEPTIH